MKKEKQSLKTDWIHFESTTDSIEVHRGRGDDKTWGGQKGKTLEWSIPVLVETDADEILKKIYSCREWEKYGKGKETSKDSKALRDKIWQLVLPHIDIKSLTPVSKYKKEENSSFKNNCRGAM